jgi:hypothetical protein
MLWTLFVMLLVLWLVGLVTSYTLGGMLHLLLALALLALVVQWFTGTQPGDYVMRRMEWIRTKLKERSTM